MRTMAGQDTALQQHASLGRVHWVRVEISTDSSPVWGGETWVDMTALAGYDWVLGVDYGENLDSPAWDATVVLRARVGDNPELNLSPFIAASLPTKLHGALVQPWRKLRIYTATAPHGTPPGQATFNLVFIGRIDDYELGENDIKLKCRDRCGELQDAFILIEQEYGSDQPAIAINNDLEDLIQDVLDDHFNTTTYVGGSAGVPYTLYSRNGTAATPWNAALDATNWSMRRWQQRKQSVWQAVAAMAQNIAYQLRFRYHEGTGIDDMVLVLEEPDRAASVANITYNPLLGQATIASIGLQVQDVRNFWRVGYAAAGGELATYQAGNTASQNKYGFRPAEIIYDASSLIDTATEGQRLVDNLLDDTQEPTVRMQVQLPYQWFLQLNDLVEILPDNRLTDAAQKLAVVARRNTLSQGGAGATTLTLQGLPKFTDTGHQEIVRRYSSRRTSPTRMAGSIAYGGLMVNADLGDLGAE